ncbi:hypothetical protein N9M16_01315 [Candidatus Dependentiae bacterium]|nr:hypothetical protein [Candidatus Dependentiae bacterium]
MPSCTDRRGPHSLTADVQDVVESVVPAMDARSVPSSGSRAPNTRHLRVGSMPPETFLPVCVFPVLRDASRPPSALTDHHRITNASLTIRPSFPPVITNRWRSPPGSTS